MATKGIYMWKLGLYLSIYTNSKCDKYKQRLLLLIHHFILLLSLIGLCSLQILVCRVTHVSRPSLDEIQHPALPRFIKHLTGASR